MKIKGRTLKLIMFIMLLAIPVSAAILGDSMINVQDSNYSVLKGNRVKDAGTLGSAQSSGLMATGLYGYNGATWDRLLSTTGILNVALSGSGTVTSNQGTANTQANRWPFYLSNGTAEWGTTGNPLNVTALQATGTNLHVVVDSGTVNPTPSGTIFYSIKRVDIGAVSVNLAFGFTSKKIIVEVSSDNTDEICIDWIGGTAVCPSANTAGDDRLSPGFSIVLDDYAATSVSIISASGTQTVYVRAF